MRNFGFVLSGLTSWIIEAGRLGDRPNPLFAWARPYFIGPFSAQEATDLAVGLGRRMGIEWSSSAIDALRRFSGGHPYLLRTLASQVASSLEITPRVRRVTDEQVVGVVDSWRLDVAGNFREIVDHLRRYYPDELAVVELLLAERGSGELLAQVEPEAINHLLHLGVLELDKNGVFEPVYAIEALLG